MRTTEQRVVQIILEVKDRFPDCSFTQQDLDFVYDNIKDALGGSGLTLTKLEIREIREVEIV